MKEIRVGRKEKKKQKKRTVESLFNKITKHFDPKK